MRQYPAAVLFDLDDTLISFEGVSQQAWDDCCADFIARHRPAFTKESLLGAIHSMRSWYWSDLQRHKVGRENIGQARRDVVGLALTTFGLTDAGLIRELADQYTATQDALIYRFPNTIVVLDALRAHGVRLVLVTNGTSQGQRAK